MKSVLKCFAERGRAAALWGLGAPVGSAPRPLATRRCWAGKERRAGRRVARAPPSGCGQHTVGSVPGPERKTLTFCRLF